MKYQSIWHFRYSLPIDFDDGPFPSRKKPPHKLRLSLNKWNCHRLGGVTIIAIPHPHEDAIHWAIQRCHHTDAFNRKEALQRVYEKLQNNPVITRNYEFEDVKKHINTIAKIKTTYFNYITLSSILEPSPGRVSRLVDSDMFIH